MIDPSDLTGGDALGIMGAQLKNDGSNKIEFKLAKQFWHGPLSSVAKYIQGVHKTVHPNFVGMEINRKDDKKTFRLLREKHKLSFIQGVKTSANLTEKTRQMGYTMDKPFMVKWMRTKKKDHELSFPSIVTTDMQEFIDQIAKITEFKTMGGATTYKAYRGQHDDLFIAGLHCCNFIRLWIDQQARLR